MLKQQFQASLPLLLALSPLASAMTLYEGADTEFAAKVQGAAGLFHSRESYGQTGVREPGSVNWQEATLQYGIEFKHRSAGLGQVFGALDWVSSASFGDGDAAGWSVGDERTTKIENAYLGWRNDSLEISGGRQNVVVGDGFLISGDALNIGRGLLDGEVNRGGAYYLTGRKAFDQTAILRWGCQQSWRGDLMWLKSDNLAQASPELSVVTLEHVADAGTVGLTAIKVTDTDQALAQILYPERKGMKLYSVRAQGNAGVSDLFLAGEHAWERKPGGADENAWYLEAGWTFSQLPGKPSVNYRYSRFSEGYDPLFYGNGRALGTWFQGEVASNYAGPFNSNTRVHHLGVKAAVSGRVNVGALYYDFATLNRSLGNRDARELDLYAEWTIDEHWSLLPLVGYYKPERSAEDGGSQLGTAKGSVYGQVLLVFGF